MKKRIFAAIFLMTPLTCIAQDYPFEPTHRGITIIPMHKQNMPDTTRNTILASRKEQSEKGYKETTDDSPRFLLGIQAEARKQLTKKTVRSYGVMDTHIKKSFTEIKLSFPFSPVKGVDENKVIGYAAIGGFKENGWDGIKEFFHADAIGNCSYARMGILSAQLSEETTEYFVNKKPSTKFVEGNVNTGFLYTINWYTDNALYTLECANINFDRDIMDKMIALANKIDLG